VADKFSVRVLARLADAEQRTQIATEQQDYRIAWLTVLRADEGNAEPWRQAFWEIVGNVPEKAIPFWLASQDAAFDEHFPLSMLPLRYTKTWASDYLCGKMIAERAREAKLPPKKQSHSVPMPKLRRATKKPKGFSMWPALMFVVLVCAAVVVMAHRQTSRDFTFSAPADKFQILRRFDAYHYQFRWIRAGSEPVAINTVFCSNYEPQLSEGETLTWLHYQDLGRCWDILPEGYGYRFERDAQGNPTLSPGCVFNDRDLTDCKLNPSEARF